MTDIDSAMESVKIGLSLFSEAIGLARKTQEILPESEDKVAIGKSLMEADKAVKFAEAQIAQALGYNLCKCTFPPQVMLSKGYKETNYTHQEEFVCPLCHKSSIPPDAPALPSDEPTDY